MGDNFSIPNPADMYDNVGWGKFYGNTMRNPIGPSRTSAGISGGIQYVTTSTSLSDILQGTLNFRDPVEIANTVNVALTKQLESLNTPGLTQFSLMGYGAESVVGSDGEVGVTPYEGSSTPDATEPTLANFNTAEDMKYAGKILIDHPNFWIDTENMSNSGALTNDGSGSYAKNFTSQLLNGFTPDNKIVSKILIKDASGKAFIFPNLINLMYYICDNGYILGRTTGFAGYKVSKNGNVSQHSYGGAGDIHRVGRAKEGVTYEVSDPKSHPIIREIYTLIDQLSEGRQPTEVGGPFEPTPGSKEDIYYTNAEHKDHLHIGFSPGKEGSLFSKLLPPERVADYTDATRSTGQK